MNQLVISLSLAKKIGLNESIVLQQLANCIKSEGVLMDNFRWVAKTYNEWQDLFPFWSLTTIKRLFMKLHNLGYLKIEQYGKHSYDRTNWYSICEDIWDTYFSNDTVTTIENDDPELEEKMTEVEKRLKELNFYPLREEQVEELKEVCQSYSLQDIFTALEATVARSIYAWKYAYKILLTNNNNSRSKYRKPIRQEQLPEWFGKEDQTSWEFDEQSLALKKYLEGIQEKYKKKKNSVVLTS